jgi:UDP-glucose 4-epimerase
LVIHFAAKKAVGESCHDPFLYYENNIDGTINLLKAMEKFGVENIIFSSSATVYDAENLLPPFSESDRLKTINPYGTTKLVIEYLLRDMVQHKGFNAIALRYFNPIGAHPSHLIGENPKGIPTNLLPFLLKVAQGEIEKLNVFGNDYDTADGTCIRDYIHVMDVAEAHFSAAKYLHDREQLVETSEIHTISPLWEVANIGTGYGKSVKEMIGIVSTVVGHDIPTVVVERRDGDAPVSLANPLKAKKLFDREAKRSIMQAVEDARMYFQQQPEKGTPGEK